MINRSFYRTISAFTMTALFGCGGSDGGNSATSSLSVPQTKFELESTAYETASVKIPFSVNYVAGDNLYYSVHSQSELLPVIDINVKDDNSGYVNVNFKPGYELGTGTKSATITFNICHDYYCDEHYSGSPRSVKLTNAVTLDEKIIRAESKIEVTADYNDVEKTAKNFTGVANFSGVNTHQIHLKAQTSNPIIASVDPITTPSSIDLNMAFVKPSRLSGGAFKTDVTIEACYDFDCNYHIEGSPVKIPVNYTVTGTIPTPIEEPSTPTTIITNNSKIDFERQLSHNVIDAAYSDAMNVIAVISNFPKNAVYFYNLADMNSYGFNLTEEPTSIAVDNLNNTNLFVVGHNMMITTVSYDTKSPQNSQINRVFNHHDIFDLTTDGEYVWTIPKENHWVFLQVIKLDNSSTQLVENGSYYEKSKLKVNPTGSALYSLTSALSPRDIFRADLINPASPGFPERSIFDDIYSLCNDFWFNHSGTSIFTQCGVKLNASDNANEDMRYEGQITLPPTQGWPYYSAIETLDESHDSTKLAYAMQGEEHTIRVLSSSDLSLQESFTLDNSTIENIDYPTTPKFLFYGADGKLNIVGTAITNTETHTLIFQH